MMTTWQSPKPMSMVSSLQSIFWLWIDLHFIFRVYKGSINIDLCHKLWLACIFWCVSISSTNYWCSPLNIFILSLSFAFPGVGGLDGLHQCTMPKSFLRAVDEMDRNGLKWMKMYENGWKLIQFVRTRKSDMTGGVVNLIGNWSLPTVHRGHTP